MILRWRVRWRYKRLDVAEDQVRVRMDAPPCNLGAAAVLCWEYGLPELGDALMDAADQDGECRTAWLPAAQLQILGWLARRLGYDDLADDVQDVMKREATT